MSESGLEKIRTRPQRSHRFDECGVCRKPTSFLNKNKPWCKKCRSTWKLVKSSPLDRANFIDLLNLKEATRWLYELTDPIAEDEQKLNEENEKLHRKLAQFEQEFARMCARNQRRIDELELELEARDRKEKK